MLTVALAGCSSYPVKTERNVFATIEQERNVDVQIQQAMPFYRNNGTEIDVWTARLINNNTSDKCVRVDWKVIDYNTNISNGWTYIPAKSTLIVGSLVQETWPIMGDDIPFPDAVFAIADVSVVDGQAGNCVVKLN